MDTSIAQIVLSTRAIAFARTDRNLNIEELGGSDEVLYSYSDSLRSREVVPKSLFDLSPELHGYEDELDAILSGQAEHHSLELVNRGDTEKKTTYVWLQSFPIRSETEQITGILHIIEDVSQLGNYRQRLTQQRNELMLLNSKINKRNLALAAANTELKQLDQMKSQFVSTAAHELRTPLSTISGYIEILLEPGYDDLTDEQSRCLGIVERNTKRLIRITDDLLDVSSIEAGRIDLLLRPLWFPKLIDMTVKDLQPMLDAKAQKLTIHVEPELPKVLCDENRTMQILSNLVSNAIKYTPDKGIIELRLQTADTDGFILFSVTDNGIGIPENDRQKLFESLVRATNVSQSRSPGVGLGLYIVRSLVELHGGQVWLESEEGKGTTFYATFPADDGLFG